LSASKSGLGCGGFLVKDSMDSSNYIKMWLQDMNPGIIGEGDVYTGYELTPGVIHPMDICKLEISGTLDVVLFNPYLTMQSITAFSDHKDTLITTGSFVTGISYEITTAGDTTWTDIGAADNNVGTEFVATGLGGGTTGVAKTVGTIGAACVGHEKLINQLVKIDESTNFNSARSSAGYPVGITDADNFYFSATWVLNTYLATALVVGRTYTIVTAGTTDYTSFSNAADNNVGTEFTTTGLGSGTGTASLVEIGRFW
jgi:hypothetical protein